MEIKKKLTDPTQNIHNPIPTPIPDTSNQTLNQGQKKTSTVGLGALGNLQAPKTSAPELKITMEIQEIEKMLLFAMDPLGALFLTKDPALSIMVIVGAQAWVHQSHHDAIMAHLDLNDHQIGQVDFRMLDKTVIPEELWGELHVQIDNLKPLLIAIVPQTSETATAPEKEMPKTAVKQMNLVTPTPRQSRTDSKSMKWKQAMILFLEETNKIQKATKERHEKEKVEEQMAKKEEIIKKEIENYEQKLSRIKDSTTQKEMLSHLKEWSESLPPCPVRLLNAMTMWRELVNKCVVKNVVG